MEKVVKYNYADNSSCFKDAWSIVSVEERILPKDAMVTHRNIIKLNCEDPDTGEAFEVEFASRNRSDINLLFMRVNEWVCSKNKVSDLHLTYHKFIDRTGFDIKGNLVAHINGRIYVAADTIADSSNRNIVRHCY